MASESQRIMNLSLTKIVSSRSRRGGVSLHRNLLVASVLFKARDVYAAEMAGLVVIRNGCVYDPSTVDDCVDMKAETQDLSNENLHTDETPVTADENLSTTDENLIRDEQIMETVSAVVCPPSVSDSMQEQSPQNKSDCELESCKENIEPANSNQTPADGVSKVTKRKRSRKLQSKQCLKRSYTEVEQAVLSITESDESAVPTKMLRVEAVDCGENTDLTCNELPDWDSDRVCPSRDENQVTTSQDYKSSCLDISDDAYSSCVSNDDDDQSTYDDDVGSYQSNFHSFSSDYCTSSSSSDAITFSLSHPMLVISV